MSKKTKGHHVLRIKGKYDNGVLPTENINSNNNTITKKN